MQTAALQLRRVNNGDATARPHRSPSLLRNASTRWYSPARLSFGSHEPMPQRLPYPRTNSPWAVLLKPHLGWARPNRAGAAITLLRPDSSGSSRAAKRARHRRGHIFSPLADGGQRRTGPARRGAPRIAARPSGGAGPESWHGALAVVPYLNPQLVRPIANGHVRVAGKRVLERIRQAFLDDARGGEVNPSREGRAIPARASGTCRYAVLAQPTSPPASSHSSVVSPLVAASRRA